VFIKIMSANNQKFDKWHGIDRKKIDWYPVIDEKKCIGCGMCVTTCSRGVYKYDFKNRKAKVVNPYIIVWLLVKPAPIYVQLEPSVLLKKERRRGRRRKE